MGLEMSALGILSWNLTSKCNLKCVHCYLDACTSGSAESIFDIGTVERVVMEAKALGVQIVFLSGGEPLMLSQLPSFVRVVRDAGLRPYICTNLTLLSEKKAIELKRAGLASISVGIDHVHRKAFDAFRGKGAYRRVIQGLKVCREIGLKVNIDFTLTRLNADAIQSIHKFAVEQGCVQVSLKRYVPEGRGMQNSDILLLDPSTYRDCLFVWAIKSRYYSERIRSVVHDPFYPVLLHELGAGNASSRSVIRTMYGCKAGGGCLGG